VMFPGINHPLCVVTMILSCKHLHGFVQHIPLMLRASCCSQRFQINVHELTHLGMNLTI
jgi:hypothetical protein